MIKRIQSIQKDPDLVYGYHCMTKQLQQEGYRVNHKKVYRLMKENQLLYPKQKANGKTYVKYRKDPVPFRSIGNGHQDGLGRKRPGRQCL